MSMGLIEAQMRLEPSEWDRFRSAVDEAYALLESASECLKRPKRASSTVNQTQELLQKHLEMALKALDDALGLFEASPSKAWQRLCQGAALAGAAHACAQESDRRSRDNGVRKAGTTRKGRSEPMLEIYTIVYDAVKAEERRKAQGKKATKLKDMVKELHWRKDPKTGGYGPLRSRSERQIQRYITDCRAAVVVGRKSSDASAANQKKDTSD
jgi:hypothetical protein